DVTAMVHFSISAIDSQVASNWTQYVDHVVVTPATANLGLYGSLTLTAQAFNASNQPLSGIAFAWTTSDGSTLPITSSTATTATLNARLIGAATISARSTAYATTGTATVSVGPSATTILYDRFTGTNETGVVNHTPDVAMAGGAWATWNFPSVVLRNGR